MICFCCNGMTRREDSRNDKEGRVEMTTLNASFVNLIKYEIDPFKEGP